MPSFMQLQYASIATKIYDSFRWLIEDSVSAALEMMRLKLHLNEKATKAVEQQMALLFSESFNIYPLSFSFLQLSKHISC